MGATQPFNKFKPEQKLSVYQQVMGHDFYKMPVVFRKIHSGQYPISAEGQMEVLYGKSILAKICKPFLPMPPAGTYTLKLEIVEHKKGEEWVRTFPQKNMRSIQYCCKGKLYEQFGWSHFAFDLKLSENTLIFNCTRQYFLFLPIPKFLSVVPYAIAVADDYHHWEMEVSVSLWGVVLAQYKGVMTARQCENVEM